MNRIQILRLMMVVLVLACTAGCDQATKHLARTQLSDSRSRTVAGGVLEFTLAENPGAFLSLGASLPTQARTFLSACVALGLAALFAFLLRSSRLSRLTFLAMSLVWAGGMSNLLDRFGRNGLVTDFMILRAGPFHTGIFNVADVAIVAGTLILFLSWLSNARDRSFNQ